MGLFAISWTAPSRQECFMRRFALLSYASAMLATVSIHRAEAVEYRMATDFGPVVLEVNPSQGTVFGSYPKFSGSISGHMTQHGDIQGIWIQPRGDQPCRTPRDGSYNWGRMHFTDPSHGLVRGRWGYCDGPLDQEWNGTRR
jgi:hypothetical protein